MMTAKAIAVRTAYNFYINASITGFVLMGIFLAGHFSRWA